MKESTMSQAIVEEGRFQEVREGIRRLGEQKFRSPPPARVQTTLEGMQDLEQLRRLLDRILTAAGWEELIVPTPQQTPPPRTRRE
jgi:hypothetical protein